MKKIIQKNIEIIILILIILIAGTILFIKMNNSNNKNETVAKHAISNESELDDDINVLNNSTSTGVSSGIGIPSGTPQTITPRVSFKNVIINNSLNKTQNNNIIKNLTNTSATQRNTVSFSKSDTQINNSANQNNSNIANQSTINSTTKENKVEIANTIKTDAHIKNTSSNSVSTTSKVDNAVKNTNNSVIAKNTTNIASEKENNSATNTSTTNKTENTINTSGSKSNTMNKNITNMTNDSVSKNTNNEIASTYTSLGTYKILNRFTGYKYNNVYLLSNGQAFIQNDFITQSSIGKNNEEAELRIGNSVSTLYSLYVKSMKKEIKVYKMSTTQSHVVFPQREYDYNAKQLEIFTGSFSYENKLKDIKSNWTNLKKGRVIQFANSSAWEQTSTEFSTFSPNAIAYHISYGVYDYLYIDGVDELISVKKYWY